MYSEFFCRSWKLRVLSLITLAVIDSTNQYVKLHAHTLANFSLIRARYQTDGRGQFLRKWHANNNENILCSLFITTLEDDSALKSFERKLLNQLFSFFKYYGVEAKAKAPNDILVDGKKISGMLIETKRTGTKLEYVIIGLGININQVHFNDLPNATSLALITKKHYDIDDVFLKFQDFLSVLIDEKMIK
jgi:BirA family biotin operon repressor/biotin-[acetyl-CoA-carboxylase] ligase